jgi:hypothetical protein
MHLMLLDIIMHVVMVVLLLLFTHIKTFIR